MKKPRFYWNDTRALEFARVAAGGAYGIYRGAKSIESKLKIYKQLIRDNMKQTRLYVIIDEAELKVVTDPTGKPLKFKTHAAANMYAAERLEVWEIHRVAFDHKFIGHDVAE